MARKVLWLYHLLQSLTVVLDLGGGEHFGDGWLKRALL